MWPIRDSLVEETPCLGEMQQKESNCCQKDDEEEQDPGAWDVHASAFITNEVMFAGLGVRGRGSIVVATSFGLRSGLRQCGTPHHGGRFWNG